MNMNKVAVILFFAFLPFLAFTQVAEIKGTLIDAISREPISDATIILQPSNLYAVSDNNGSWQMIADPGLYNITISHISYKDKILYEKRIRIAQDNFISQSLFPSDQALEEITISSAKVKRSAENGTNIKTIEIDEIQRMPGAVMDISKVIKNFPGVAPRVSFGYNIIVRGGGSFENKFFLDGIEIPAITHFNVQGLAGGPNGSINTDLISRATFKSGSFPVNRSNALSSIMDLEQKTGRRDRVGAKFTLGAAEYGMHVEGPMGKNSSYILSARKSYTEYLLKAFNLPVLPAFTDFQYKHKFWLPNKDHLTIVGLGAFDQYRLNLDGESTDAILYNTGYIPEGDQQSMTFGANYKHFSNNGFYNIVASHTRFRNLAYKYYDNSGNPEDQSLDFNSIENETKFRIENKTYLGKSTFNYGINYDLVDMQLDEYSIFSNQINQVDTLNFNSDINYQKYGLFTSYSIELNKKWNLYLGARMDGNTFGQLMNNPFKQFSPRASIQYVINPRLKATLQAGRYYQLPPSILLAYKEDNKLINQNNLEYIQANQASFGIDYEINKYRQLNIDVFYKKYNQYPFLLRDSVSFANISGEYVSVGNQEATSDSEGRAYGAEFFVQQKLYNNWFGNVSASYIVSQFEDKNGQLVNSSWDNRFFMNLTFGKELKNNWTIGAKWTYSGSSPYTPYDVERSSNVVLWEANRRGVFDYDQLNENRLPAYHTLDFRVDKKWYRNNMTIIAFIDLQNMYNNKFQLIPYLTVVRNQEGENQTLDTDPSRYETQIINSDTGRVLPTIGFSIEL